MKTILLLEDDEHLNTGIARRLAKEGYKVLQAYTIREARALADTHEVVMLISDVMLPDGNGMEFASKLRKERNVYLIYLTAMDQEMDIVSGYDMGADDYITKPFSLLILLSKVNAFMRRYEEQERACLCSGEIRVYPEEMKVYRENELISLSKKEMQILIFLMEHAGQIVTKGQILEHVWDKDGDFVDENTVAVNISRLKSRLGMNAISNVRGIGYIWTKAIRRE